MGSPYFRTERQRASGATEACQYFQRVGQGDLSTPGTKGLKYLSKKIDEVTKSVYDELEEVLTDTPEHKRRLALLKQQPRTGGTNSVAKALFKDVSPFEQMVVVKEWQEDVALRDTHTFCLAKGQDDFIPVRAKAGLMQTVLGTTTGSHKAPKYEDWAVNDPWANPSQKPFIHPLESLEIVRQPQFSGATVLKGNAFETECVDQAWRYGTEKGCVELKGQSKNSQKKLASAGLNLAELEKTFTDAEDPAESPNICNPISYEDYADEGYRDEVDEVSPAKLVSATRKAIINQNDTDLEDCMKKLFIAKIGTPSTPGLRTYIAAQLFPED